MILKISGKTSGPMRHNANADWIDREKDRAQNIAEMEFETIGVEEIKSIIKKTHNWKAPGPDGLHNFWLKRLESFHEIIAKQITEILRGRATIPHFLTKGITFMVPKSSRTEDPSQYRPITCLPTLYKLITSCISQRINKHSETHNILAEEQKECRAKHMGCKEQLIIDSAVLKHVQKGKKDLFVAYVDYKKAFDSIPHSWLLHILEIYKINPHIINFLKNIMPTWRTVIKLQTKNRKHYDRRDIHKKKNFSG